MRLTNAIGLTLVLALAAGCAPNYRGEFAKLSNKKDWTKEEKAVAREYSYRYFGKKQDDGTYVVLYTRLPTTLVRKQIESLLADVDAVLSYQKAGMNRYLKWTGRREHFEHQEEVFQAIYARVRLLELHGNFEKAIGARSGSSSNHKDEFGVDHRDGYDPAVLALSPDELNERFPFTSEFLEKAKEGGLLQEIGTYTVAETRQYAFKEPDPDFPDDSKKFIWRTREYQLEVLTYKVLDADNGKPRNNYANYAEVYRVFNGNREDLPAVRAFMNGQGGSAVAVIDLQRQGEIGHGLPDEIKKLSESRLADQDMIKKIFARPKQEENDRIEPNLPEINVQIARIGAPVDLWEQCDDGCEVPFKYENDDRNNFTANLHFVKKKAGESNGNTKTVDYIEKHWKALQPGAGEVVEYFSPLSPFDKPALDARISYRSTALYRLEFTFSDGTEESAVITPTSTAAIGEHPKAIGYNWLEKRWVIEDTDGDGTFDRKKEVADLEGGYDTSGSFNDLGNDD